MIGSHITGDDQSILVGIGTGGVHGYADALSFANSTS
ncbi:hypothetical protein BKP42_66370 [Rhodococcus erythropolis]|nr:hypothetical protein BKP42_66370 [Rhodococcus erythropolis]